MAFIKAYIPALREITPLQNGMGFDQATGKFVQFGGEFGHYQVLDALTAAVEAGQIDSETWISTVFQSAQLFRVFLEKLEGWSDVERLHDRWCLALQAITDQDEDEYWLTGIEAAATLLEHAEETGQI